MWLIDRLWTPRVSEHRVAAPGLPAEPASRRAPLKRPSRAGRNGVAPWQKIAPARRYRH